MAYNVFISFRYRDGKNYKKDLSDLFDQNRDTIDFSEDLDRSNMSDDMIKQYLYQKLRRSSVTIILLTPLAVNHQKNWLDKYDDWMYDEIRYSLENREGNRTNGLVAVYTPEAASLLVNIQPLKPVEVYNVDNLFRRNMMNVKPEYKKDSNPNTFNRDYDSYCSLISWYEFIKNIGKYVEIASKKRDEIYKYVINKRL